MHYGIFLGRKWRAVRTFTAQYLIRSAHLSVIKEADVKSRSIAPIRATLFKQLFRLSYFTH